MVFLRPVNQPIIFIWYGATGAAVCEGAVREIQQLCRDNAALIRELKSVSYAISADTDPRLVRTARKQAMSLAASLRWLIDNDPSIEHAWQQYRLENGVADYPTLHVFVRTLDVMAGAFYYVEARIKQERKARKP